MGMFTDNRQKGKMDLNEAMTERHSVRMYTDEPVGKSQLDEIAAEVERCNAASGLHFQMAAGLEDAFCGYKTHYGRFSGVHNAIALVTQIDKPYDLHPAKKAHPNTDAPRTSTEPSPALHTTRQPIKSSGNSRANEQAADAPATLKADKTAANTNHDDNSPAQIVDPIPPKEAEIEEKVGYYGEQLALTLVQLGLATSWAVLDDAATGWWELDPGERVVWILAFGHPARAGAKHHSKPLDSLCSLPESLGPDATLADAPDWFQRGIAAASLAPTSLGQQPFKFTLEDAQIASARITPGLFAHVGLGCAKRNFEIGAGTDNFVWAR